MPDHSKWLFLLGFVVITGMVTSAQQEPAKAPDVPISVASFGPDNVIGLLGRPLGTVVHVTGVAIAGSTRGVKAEEGMLLLKIQTVDGQLLKDPPSFLREPGDPDIQGWVSGDQFDFYCHEFGAFEGLVSVPRNVGLDESAAQGVRFRYKPEIQIHRRRQKR